MEKTNLTSASKKLKVGGESGGGMEHLTHLYPPQLPKGRGRPRATYAQTGEFDLGLIREYRSHPVLYDRTNKRFKDKLYVAQIWEQMAHQLGYDGKDVVKSVLA